MELTDALRTTGAARRFTDQAVDDATVRDILDDARFAPSGGNRQGWRVAIVKDRAIRRQIGSLMQGVIDEYSAAARNGRGAPFNAVTGPWHADPADRRHVDNPLTSEIESVPVLLAIAVDLTAVSLMDGVLDRVPITGGGSVYPFCWSILLAARARGLGGVMTTFLSRVEPAAAPLLALPADHALAATIFLGRPVQQLTKLTRRPVESFARLDRFDGPPFGG